MQHSVKQAAVPVAKDCLGVRRERAGGGGRGRGMTTAAPCSTHSPPTHDDTLNEEIHRCPAVPVLSGNGENQLVNTPHIFKIQGIPHLNISRALLNFDT